MSNKKIVIIDDDKGITQLLKSKLETEGYDISISHNGQDGLEMIKEIKPDLVILDVIMPGMDGYEVLKRIKEDSTTKDVAVIMLSIKGRLDDIQKGLELGADDYVPKPIHLGLLLKRIERILK